MKKTIYALKDFLILWGSQAVSAMGTAMVNYALILWVYAQNGSATDLARMSIFALLPSIFFALPAGTLADRWNKKTVMLLADCLAALGTGTIWLLYATDALQIWHLYAVNFLLSFMTAFQNPASYVAVSLLVPKEHFARASGLQGLSESIVSIFAPALGGVLLAFYGLELVLLVDLATFAIAFFTLLLVIKLPPTPAAPDTAKESWLTTCAVGFRYLKAHKAMLQFILFFAFVAFVERFGWGMLPAYVLARSGGDQGAYALVEMVGGIGSLAAGLLVTLAKPVKKRVRMVFLCCGIAFVLGEMLLSLGRALPLWLLSVAIASFPMDILNANKSAVMRSYIPAALQGRVSSMEDAIKTVAGVLGYLGAGYLADYVLEPFMSTASPLQVVLAAVFGGGQGSGIAVMFFVAGTIGAAGCFGAMGSKRFAELEA
ncbi:MAG: MFS transporter [Oscillospiraceae bacterium]|jgi:MFS family permease|nr:MFS transporter [Oscillospiraceae bacterium]